MNNKNESEQSLAKLVMRGGIHYKVRGSSKEEFIGALISSLPASALPSEKHESLLQAVLEREAHFSTGIENGIALPHPRTPMLDKGEQPFAAIAFPLSPLDWITPDGSEVSIIFLIVSSSPKQHLNTLTKINFLCMEKEFYDLLSSQAPKEKIIAAIEKAEKEWAVG